MDGTITEAASKKRGRPRIHDRVQTERVASFVAPDVRSDRHKQNRMFAQQGFHALYDDSANDSIPGVELIHRKATGKLCVSILEQLGRLQFETGANDEYIRDIARQANDLLRDDPRMTVKKVARAIAVIRRDAK